MFVLSALVFVCSVLCISWGSLSNPPWWPASPSGSLATPCCWYNLRWGCRVDRGHWCLVFWIWLVWLYWLGVILLLCIPLVAGEILKNPIPDHTSEDTIDISLHPFLSHYAHLSIPGFLALGLVLPCVVPHLGGYYALGSLAEALTWGILAISAVASFISQALYQHILYWFGYKPYTIRQLSHQIDQKPPSCNIYVPSQIQLYTGFSHYKLVFEEEPISLVREL